MPAVGAGGHVVIKDHTFNVTIPKGVTEGQSIRLKGQGSQALPIPISPQYPSDEQSRKELGSAR